MMTAETKATHGLLIDYEYCTGCQSCEVACKEACGTEVDRISTVFLLSKNI